MKTADKSPKANPAKPAEKPTDSKGKKNDKKKVRKTAG